VDEDGIKKIKPVIVSVDNQEVYHLSTGNLHLDGDNELGVKTRKSKRIDTGELVESKSVLISQNNMHASMNTRDSSKNGLFKGSKSMIYD